MRRAIFWIISVCYSLFLPFAIVVYQDLTRHYSIQMIHRLPLVIILAMGFIYAGTVIYGSSSLRNLWFLFPCALIIFLITSIETNPNKYIHIPEYVLMSWVVYEAIINDYRDKGILILVFFCSSLMGLIDEIVQGIYPGRYYGLKDQLIDILAVCVGIFTLLGLRKPLSGNWEWTRDFKKSRFSFGISLFGIAGAILISLKLFSVHSKGAFWGIYPWWLLLWSGIFIILVLPAIYSIMVRFKEESLVLRNSNASCENAPKKTADIWILSIMIPLVVIHSLALIIAFSGCTFR